MEYYYCKKDKYNNIHSIDNVIITYFLTCTLDFALGHIKMISDCSSNYWEKLNVSAPIRSLSGRSRVWTMSVSGRRSLQPERMAGF